MSVEKRKGGDKKYDVFISHKSDCKPWVRILAQNLKMQGFKVFLDEWELIAGRSLINSLAQGLKQSRKGIVVVTPNVYESGWVREEYEQMMIQKQEEPKFSIIPVVLGEELPRIPFLNSVLWVDFRESQKYRMSFYQLVCAIKDIAPGSDVELHGEIIMPSPSFKGKVEPSKDEISFAEELFDFFFTKQAVILLVQQDRWQGGVKTILLERAKKQYGEKNVLHLVPPFSPKVDMENYFSLLGKQCGFSQSVNKSVSLATAFEEKLVRDVNLFLMVSGFENSCQEGQEELSGVLRGLNERFPKNLKILICGGEKLEDISYNGQLSYLNHAYILEWPDLTISDVLRSADLSHPDLNINDKTAERLLQVSGGHPKILESCFELYRKNPDFTGTELTEVLYKSPFIWQLFNPFGQYPELRKQVCRLLDQEDVGPAQLYIYDPLPRKLYWRNLLKRGIANRRLYWRCEALRQVGSRILRCKKDHET